MSERREKTDGKDGIRIKEGTEYTEPLVPETVSEMNQTIELEDGVVYRSETDGIYGGSVECGSGCRVVGEIYARESVTLKPGKYDGERTTVSGSVYSEGTIKVERGDEPVVIYGDLIARKAVLDGSAVVYGNLKTVRRIESSDEGTVVVIGEAESNGTVEADNFFAFSVSAHLDVSLGKKTMVANPCITSEKGEVKIDEVGVLNEEIIESEDVSIPNLVIRQGMLEKEFERSLVKEDVVGRGEGEVASLTWRTVNEPGDRELVRNLFEKHMERRKRGMERGEKPKVRLEVKTRDEKETETNDHRDEDETTQGIDEEKTNQKTDTNSEEIDDDPEGDSKDTRKSLEEALETREDGDGDGDDETRSDGGTKIDRQEKPRKGRKTDEANEKEWGDDRGNRKDRKNGENREKEGSGSHLDELKDAISSKVDKNDGQE